MTNKVNYMEYINEILPEIEEKIRPLQSRSFLDAIIQDLRKNSMPVDFNDDNWLSNIPPKPGIYFFEADFSNWLRPWRNFVDDFEQLWKSPTNQVGASPRFNSGKAAAVADEFSNTKKLPFYIGIRNNLRARIKEHVSGPKNLKTSALWLKARQADLKAKEFTLHYVEIDIPESMHFILAIIEAGLIDKMKPITGKKSWKVFEDGSSLFHVGSLNSSLPPMR